MEDKLTGGKDFNAFLLKQQQKDNSSEAYIQAAVYLIKQV